MHVHEIDSHEQYIIKVRGKLNCNIKDYFDNFSIEKQGDQIILTGAIVDYSALMGTLERLFILGLRLDSLKRVVVHKNEFIP